MLDNKPALMRAYKKTTLRDGDGDAYVEKAEFLALLRNLVYFNKLFVVFEALGTDADRRLSLEEFEQSCGRLGLARGSGEAQQVFAEMDKNNGGMVLFDEFCAWVAQTACPVDGEVVRTFTMSDSRPVEASLSANGGEASDTADKSDSRGDGGRFDKVEQEFKDLLSNGKRRADLVALWTVLDYNGNGIVSLAEIDKLVVS